MPLELVMFDLDGTLGIFKHAERLDQVLLREYSRKLSKAFNLEISYVAKVLLDVVFEVKMVPPEGITVAEAMLNKIAEKLGVNRVALEKVTDDFYGNEFDFLKRDYSGDPSAPIVIQKLLDMGIKVAIATDPIVRRTGVLKRLKWAGVGDFPYCFISSADDNRAAKPHPKFYEEILEKCNSNAEFTIMVGDRIDNDILPAKRIGIKTVLLDRNREHGDSMADFVIVDLKDLLDIMKNFIKT